MNRILIIVMFILAACEVVVDVDIPVKPAAITVYSYINPDSLVEVQLTSSQHVLSEASFEFIQAAEVTLFENGDYVEHLSEITPGIYRGQYYPSLNSTYTLEVAKNSYETVTAETPIPEIGGRITDVTYKHGESNQFGPSAIVSFTVEFSDPPGPNYYELAMIGPSYLDEYDPDTRKPVVTDTVYVSYGLSSDDPIFSSSTNWNGGLSFKDSFIDGKTVKLTVDAYVPVFWRFPEAEADVLVILRELSAPLYHFNVTSSLQQSLEGNPFAEPVPVFNNVKNGYGVFGGYSQKSYPVIVKKE